jgi:hypothetical protein
MMVRQPISRSGGIGRRARLRAWFPLVGVQVQVLSPAVNNGKGLRKNRTSCHLRFAGTLVNFW